jgi:hypothetical protein
LTALDLTDAEREKLSPTSILLAHAKLDDPDGRRDVSDYEVLAFLVGAERAAELAGPPPAPRPEPAPPPAPAAPPSKEAAICEFDHGLPAGKAAIAPAPAPKPAGAGMPSDFAAFTAERARLEEIRRRAPGG